VYKFYVGGVLTSVETVWDEGSCFWHHHYWEEWVPADMSDEMPPAPGGGGGFFSPEDSLNREPTIDTTQKKEHKLCEGLSPHPTVGQIANKNCLTALKSRDSAWVFDSMNALLRDTALIADTADRRMCVEMRNWLDSTRVAHWDNLELTEGESGIFYRGTNNDHASDKPAHFAQSNGTRLAGEIIYKQIHYDPRMLDSLLPLPGGPGKFALATLHEVLHVAGGKDHPDITNPPTGYIGIPYFETLEVRKACTL
jgi:hypothetical protein